MNKVILLALIATLASVSSGCSIFSKFADSQKELEENAIKPIPVRANSAQTQPQDNKSEVISDLEEEEVEPLPEIAGLIPATDPEVRVRSSVRGRNDPFSIVTLNPRIQIEEKEEKPDRFNTNTNTNRTVNNRVSNRVNENDSELNLPLPEEVFEPTLAQDVVISGMLEANGRTRLIVQAPEESSSRYVEVGQYLSNGQVLVKRIDKDHFPSPMIILEQSGVEVAKTIGDDLDEDDRLSALPVTPTQDWKTAISLK